MSQKAAERARAAKAKAGPADTADPKRVSRAKKICDEIVLGRHDDFLQVILSAITIRVDSLEGPELHWRIRAFDLEVTSQNLTITEMERIERVLGRPIVKVNPAEDARSYIAIMATALIHREGLDADQALERLGSLSGSEAFRETIDTYQGPPVPFRQPA